MRAIAIPIVAVTLFALPAFAHVKRLGSMPEQLWGSWAPGPDACKTGDKAIIVVAAKNYTSAQANCTVAWVSETPGARGPVYSARLQCAKPGGGAPKAASDVIFIPNDNNQVSIGPRFSEVKDFQRCSASEPLTTR